MNPSDTSRLEPLRAESENAARQVQTLRTWGAIVLNHAHEVAWEIQQQVRSVLQGNTDVTQGLSDQTRTEGRGQQSCPSGK
jgi:hypothetical protein